MNVLDDNGVKATFFVVGWRLTPKTWGERRYEENVGITCMEAAEQLVRRGHELEDHTYSHIELRGAERKRGEQWVIGDVNRGAEAIKAVTGTRPHYLRPPDWLIADDARRDLERQGYHLLTISRENPIARRELARLFVDQRFSRAPKDFSGGCSLGAGGTAGKAGSVYGHSRLP